MGIAETIKKIHGSLVDQVTALPVREDFNPVYKAPILSGVIFDVQRTPYINSQLAAQPYESQQRVRVGNHGDSRSRARQRSR